MAKTLMESIAEDEAQLGGKPTETETPTDGDDDGKEPGKSEDERTTATEHSPEPETEARAGDRGRRGRRKPSGGTSGDASQSESGPSREDGEAPSLDSGRTRKDARAPREDAQGDVGKGVLTDVPPAQGDHAAWAKLRREKRELEAQIKTLQQKPAEAPAPSVKPKADVKAADDPEPDKATVPEEWREWRDRQRDKEIADLRKDREARATEAEQAKTFKAAIGEFEEIRNDYIKQNADYVPAFNHGFETYFKSLRVIHPRATNQEIINHIDTELLKFAGECVSKGLNPAEELYDMAIERFGYAPNSSKGKDAEVAEDEAEEDAAPEVKAPVGVRPKEKPSLRAVSNNRKRAASPLMGPGQGGGLTLTKEAVSNMTNGELLNLTPEDWAALEGMGG